MVIYVLIHIISLKDVQGIVVPEIQRHHLMPIHWDQMGCAQKRVQMQDGLIPPTTRTIRADDPHPRRGVTPYPLKPLHKCTWITHLIELDGEEKKDPDYGHPSHP
jgi:hypothetical protein